MAAAAASSGVKSWLLDKYAKQVEVESKDAPVNNAAESLSSKGSGVWKVNMAPIKIKGNCRVLNLQFCSVRHTFRC